MDSNCLLIVYNFNSYQYFCLTGFLWICTSLQTQTKKLTSIWHAMSDVRLNQWPWMWKLKVTPWIVLCYVRTPLVTGYNSLLMVSTRSTLARLVQFLFVLIIKTSIIKIEDYLETFGAFLSLLSQNLLFKLKKLFFLELAMNKRLIVWLTLH